MPNDHGPNDPKSLMRADIETIRTLLREAKTGSFRNLREMAAKTGVSKSELGLLTTQEGATHWYKKHGLSQKTLERLLQSNEISPAIKSLIERYLLNKKAGIYGHDLSQKFEPPAA